MVDEVTVPNMYSLRQSANISQVQIYRKMINIRTT